MATLTDDRSKKLTEQVHELIKCDILECKLEPGQLLDESLVSDRYQIGRTPFREACQRLESEGLVEIVPHRGVFVASFSAKEIGDLFELRMVVEPTVAEMAAQRKTGDLKALEVNLEDCQRLRKGKADQIIPAVNWNSQDFHVQVARLTRNQELIEVVERMHDRLMRIIVYTARHSPEDFPHNTFHAEIFDAIKRGKGALARKVMTKDIEHARLWVQTFG